MLGLGEFIWVYVWQDHKINSLLCFNFSVFPFFPPGSRRAFSAYPPDCVVLHRLNASTPDVFKSNFATPHRASSAWEIIKKKQLDVNWIWVTENAFRHEERSVLKALPLRNRIGVVTTISIGFHTMQRRWGNSRRYLCCLISTIYRHCIERREKVHKQRNKSKLFRSTSALNG